MCRPAFAQSKIDEAAFPIRVKVRVPPQGFGARLRDMQTWLKAELAPGNWALHGASGWGIIDDVVAYDFRSADIAARFVAAFPDFVLADGV